MEEILPDGRRSVRIEVNRLNLENPDELDLEAKKVIEEQVLTKLTEIDVLVTVIHKKTLMKATVLTKYPKVRHVAETLIAGFPGETPEPEDFIVVEVIGNEVNVSHL